MANATKTTSSKTAKHLTPREAAEELGTTAKALRVLIRAGKVKATTKDDEGKRWLIPAAEVKRLTAERS